MNRTAIMTVANVSGQNNVDYNITGAFTESGWSGIYKFTVYNSSSKTSATYTTTYTGARIVAKSAANTEETQQVKYEGNQNDLIYSLGSKILQTVTSP